MMIQLQGKDLERFKLMVSKLKELVVLGTIKVEWEVGFITDIHRQLTELRYTRFSDKVIPKIEKIFEDNG